MKLSQIGASIVAFAAGVDTILTVIEQWHNIEQWVSPSVSPTPGVSSPAATTSISDQLANVWQKPIYIQYWNSDGAARTTKLYDRTTDEITLNEIERIGI
jgi:hypothetical protein